MAEDPLAMAERHVREFEANVARQRVILDEMIREDHPTEAEQAKAALATYEDSLRLAHEHLRMEREARGLEP